jgi:hypothetical protein
VGSPLRRAKSHKRKIETHSNKKRLINFYFLHLIAAKIKAACMQKILSLLSLVVLMLLFSKGMAQTAKATVVDTKRFHLDTTIAQNKSIFKFWMHIPDTAAEHSDEGDTLKNRLMIERITKLKDTIIFNDGVKDGDYFIGDDNGDGYTDLTTFYHEERQVSFFNPATNNFSSNALAIPDGEMIDDARHISYGSYEAMYGNVYAYSALYKLKNNALWYYYKILFITNDEYEGKEAVKHVNLYRCRNGWFNDTVFVREIKTDNPSKFDEGKYWKQHYKTLLGISGK